MALLLILPRSWLRSIYAGIGYRSQTRLVFKNGNFNDVIVSLIVLSNTTMLVGGLAFMRELVKEREIYKRERMVNLKLSSYIMSKIWVALVLAIYQTICYTAIRYTAFEMPGGNRRVALRFHHLLPAHLWWHDVGTFCIGIGSQWKRSAVASRHVHHPADGFEWSHGAAPYSRSCTRKEQLGVSRCHRISGAGSDVAHNSCWALTKEERDDHHSG